MTPCLGGHETHLHRHSSATWRNCTRTIGCHRWDRARPPSSMSGLIPEAAPPIRCPPEHGAELGPTKHHRALFRTTSLQIAKQTLRVAANTSGTPLASLSLLHPFGDAIWQDAREPRKTIAAYHLSLLPGTHNHDIFVICDATARSPRVPGCPDPARVVAGRRSAGAVCQQT